ncbi:hypothetical protein PCE1_002829 [Barthelona sp. PCE]
MSTSSNDRNKRRSSTSRATSTSRASPPINGMHLTYLRDISYLDVNIVSRTPLPVKTIKNRYQLFEVLGEGSFGKVRRAYDMETEQFCAVKSFNRQKLSKVAGFMEAVEREVELMLKLKHRNVVQVIDYINDGESSRFYLVMELLTGGNLEDRVNANPKGLLLRNVKVFFRDLISALSHIHSQKIAHRDIKPDNIVFTGVEGSERIVLLDFGAAEIEGARPPETARQWGSPAFQSPECARDEEFIDPYKQDLWAFGVSLHYCMTGSLPFDSSPNVFSLVDKICKGEIHIYPFLPPLAKDLLTKLLQIDPELRISAVEALEHDFFATERQITKSKLHFLKPNVRGFKLNYPEEEEEEKQLTRSFDKHFEHTLLRPPPPLTGDSESLHNIQQNKCALL